ncbi:hypothetical protein BofuT4_P068940.1 [Botrytis cinerea T4]|uniref:Uncharacterized protein n=1 Tax=Botryotinia fuckeliana (strain T4) TaxID=999810 RepID=G2XQE9_BOTF4|nr:hypothetical protein BofuT4_P068940.1 [Botrytis cinerea T4]
MSKPKRACEVEIVEGNVAFQYKDSNRMGSAEVDPDVSRLVLARLARKANTKAANASLVRQGNPSPGKPNATRIFHAKMYGTNHQRRGKIMHDNKDTMVWVSGVSG